MSSYTKSNKTQKILVVTPSLKGLGGVANYYKALLPYLKNGDFVIDNLAIGSVNSKTKILHPLTDQIRFNKTINRHNYTLVHLNPSMYSKSFIREFAAYKICIAFERSKISFCSDKICSN